MPLVTVEDVAAYAPSAPPVTSATVEAAIDWAVDLFELQHAPLPEGDTRQARELRRAICAYALSTLPLTTLLGNVSDAQRLTSIRDGDTALTFATVQRDDLTGASADFTARAYDHLARAGLRRSPWAVGYSE